MTSGRLAVLASAWLDAREAGLLDMLRVAQQEVVDACQQVVRDSIPGQALQNSVIWWEHLAKDRASGAPASAINKAMEAAVRDARRLVATQKAKR